MLDMIVDSKGNAYAVGKSFNGTTFDLLAISWFANGTRRWIRTDVPPPQPDYVLFNGSGNGDDLGGCIHLNSIQDLTHDADVLTFGMGLVNTGGANVVRYILNKYDRPSLPLDAGAAQAKLYRLRWHGPARRPYLTGGGERVLASASTNCSGYGDDEWLRLAVR